MSNIYIQEPPALGKVLLQTSVGDIDIELWTKEAPKACRNFIQLCMEGYYKGTIFHRVVSDFIVQGGDPNGDGSGGESIYGAPFKDEFHQRLRFNRRGLVAMANAGKDDNGSQFFFTLAATPELQNKHTIFGKVVGDSIYTMLKLAEGEIGVDDRPLYPRIITGSVVLINPFDDIVARHRQQPVKEKPKKKREKGTKNFGLLSFGDEAVEDESEAGTFVGAKSSHDLLDDPKLSHNTAADLGLDGDVAPPEQKTEDSELEIKNAEAVSNVRDKLKRKQAPQTEKEETRNKEKAKKRNDTTEIGKERSRDSSDSDDYYIGKDKDVARRKERDRIREEITKLKQDMKKTKDVPVSEADIPETSKDDSNELKKRYEEEQEKYRKQNEKIPKKGAARQDYTLALLEKFKSKLSAMKQKADDDGGTSKADDDGGTSKADDDGGKSKPRDDDDVSGDDWMAHKLQFDAAPVLAKDASTKGDDWFDIYDPRNPLNKRKREESERKQKEKLKKR